MPDILSVIAILGALLTATAALLSLGHVASTGIGDGRFGLLSLSPLTITFALAAAAVVFVALRRGASAAPLALLALVALPWTPVPLPAVLLVWTGPLVILVWLAIALCFAVEFPWRGLLTAFGGPRGAAVLAYLLGAIAFWQVAPSLPSGDEPHYLVITQSLLSDGDVKIENNHQQRDYRDYFAGNLRMDFRVRGRNGEVYSIHAPGVAALVAPAFAVGGYHGVVFFLIALSAAGSALAWHLAWLITRRIDAAWAGWAAVTLSTTWLFHSFAIFPDGPGAVAVLSGAWALLRAEREIETQSEHAMPWFWHGVALATLPWMHTRFAALAGTLGALVILRLGRSPNALVKAGAFLVAPIVSAIGWIAFFMVIYGTPDPSAPYGNEPGSFAFVPDGLAGLFFDQRFGLFAYAPVLLFAVAGIGFMLARAPWRRHALELLFVAVPYLVVVTYVAMWWGGTSAPARFFVPLLPWMAVPVAVAWTQLPERHARVAWAAALAFTVFAAASLVLVGDGRLAFSTREEYARWLEWLNGSVDLGRGLPIWWRDRETPLFRGMAIWAACGGAAWVALFALRRVRALQPRARFCTAAAGVFAVAGMTALSVTWAAEGTSGRTPTEGQLELLRRLAREPRVIALQLGPLQRVAPEAVPALLRIDPLFSRTSGGAGQNDRPLFAIPNIPAGDYRLRFTLRATEGWLMLGIGRDQFALRTEPIEAVSGGVELRFPVDVRAIMVRGDEDARRNVRGLTLEPLRIVRPAERVAGDYARRAVRYPDSAVYFLDERSFPDPEGFWVGGGRESTIVIQPDQPRSSSPVFLRNGATANTVTLESGAWKESIGLAAGEERRIDVPMDQSRGAARLRITTSAGFRPSEVDPKSRDDRFLGVWVKIGAGS